MAQSEIQANVSRETFETLVIYEELLRKWTKRINLVATSTLDDLWSRHFLDSLQLMTLVDKNEGLWLDLGSGGGFPGLVCAIAARETTPDIEFQLIESDQRKAAFLNAVLREIDVNATVMPARIESLPKQISTFISARALASIDNLLEMSEALRDETTTIFLLKGSKAQEEIRLAAKKWRFRTNIVPSQTDPAGAIVVLKEVSRA